MLSRDVNRSDPVAIHGIRIGAVGEQTLDTRDVTIFYGVMKLGRAVGVGRKGDARNQRTGHSAERPCPVRD
jgi:hypothetical protein